jgi:catechol 2,3-dioxygenase
MNETSPSTLPADLWLGPVTLAVADLARSEAFYVDVLGMQCLDQSATTRTFGVVGRPLITVQYLPGATPKSPRSTGLYHVAVLVPSRAALGNALARLLQARYPLAGAADHRVSEALYLADPDGNGLEIYRDRPRNEWPWHNGGVQMTTDPLDLYALIEAGAQAAELGGQLPDKTVIGHMHLQVADLAQAEAFYCGVLGMAVMMRLPDALFVSAGGYHHHLGLNSWTSRGGARPATDAAGLRRWSVVTADAAALHALHQRLVQAEVAVQPTADTLIFDDPWGHTLLVRWAE